MRLDDLDPSNNVRDLGSGGGGGGGGIPILGMLLPFLFRGKMGCGTIGLLLIVGAFYLFSGGLGGLTGGGTAVGPATQQGAATGGGTGAATSLTAAGGRSGAGEGGADGAGALAGTGSSAAFLGR